jgi:hypothetical protein
VLFAFSAAKNMEKSRFWPQQYPAMFEKIKSQILAISALLAHQGSICSTWRKRGNMRFGPYYRLRYFENGRRRSIYLGQSEDLVQKVRLLLSDLQFNRISHRLKTKIRESLRLQKRILQQHLLANGYRLKGNEIHKLKQTNGQIPNPGRIPRKFVPTEDRGNKKGKVRFTHPTI